VAIFNISRVTGFANRAPASSLSQTLQTELVEWQQVPSTEPMEAVKGRKFIAATGCIGYPVVDSASCQSPAQADG
jgi:hypothetical protein